jgi:hypothetical protein
MGLRIAGRTVDDPMPIWRDYARDHRRTLLEYDLGGCGDAGQLTADEAWRSRIIGSRLTRRQRDRLVARASDSNCPWSSVSAGTRLSDADPDKQGAEFDKAAALYWHFTQPSRIWGVRAAKLHKILHVKHPALYPILDSKVRRLYRDHATAWVSRLSRLNVTIRDSPPYWAAIRADLVLNRDQLDSYRRQLACDNDAMVRSMAQLSNLRLQDIVAWRIAR